MAIIELTHSYQTYGEVCTNRYHYVTASYGTLFPTLCEELVDAWVSSYLPAVLSFLASNVPQPLGHDIVARSIYDPTDFAEALAVGGVGARPGTSNPSNWAVSCRSPRLLSGANRAQKRYSGISETDVSGNTPVGSWLSAINAWFDFLTTPFALTDGTNTDTLDFVMLRYEFIPETPTVKAHYAPYGTEAEQRSANRTLVVPSMDFYRYSSQRSRMPGVGT